MFEDSLMESQNRLSSPRQNWATIVSITLQCSVAAGVIALPLLHPEVLHLHTAAPTLTLQPKPPMPRIPHIEARSSATASSVPSAPPGTAAVNFHHIVGLNSVSSDAPAATTFTGNMGDTNVLPEGMGTAGTGTRVTAAPTPPTGPVHISSGVSAGLLLSPIHPIYPPIAISTRTEGVVIIEATISRTGRIESARATSGPTLLREAALAAIRNERYSPYLLNGLPTAVETTITVNFKLAG